MLPRSIRFSAALIGLLAAYPLFAADVLVPATEPSEDPPGAEINLLNKAGHPGNGPVAVPFELQPHDIAQLPADPPVTNTHFLTDRPGPRDLQPLIRDLHSPQFSTRELATDILLHLPTGRLSEVRDALVHESDAEAASRLMQVAMHLYLKGQTPLQGRSSLLGIKFRFDIVRLDPKKPDEFRLTIVIAELQPGYPAAQDLRVGDRLLAIDGKSFPLEWVDTEFRDAINSRRPGSVITFTVLRGAEQLEIPVQLAGLPAEGIENAINERNERLKNFAASIHTAADSKPQVLPDPSQGPDSAIRIENGVIYRNGEILVIPQH